MSSVPVIGPADVGHLLDWTALCDAMEAAHLGPRAEIGDTFLSRAQDTLLSRSAWIEGLGVGVKSVMVLPGNPAAGRPTVQGAMLVFDDSTGTPRALIDNALI
ncbi:MAG: ornithine cyclodeaminase, partial [Pseudomonadota bacterium]